MNTTLERLRSADPAAGLATTSEHRAVLRDSLIGAHDGDEAMITALPPTRSHTSRNRSIALVALGTAAALVVTVGSVVTGGIVPGQLPPPASAAEVFTRAATAAAASGSLELSGSERAYTSTYYDYPQVLQEDYRGKYFVVREQGLQEGWSEQSGQIFWRWSPTNGFVAGTKVKDGKVVQPARVKEPYTGRDTQASQNWLWAFELEVAATSTWPNSPEQVAALPTNQPELSAFLDTVAANALGDTADTPEQNHNGDPRRTMILSAVTVLLRSPFAPPELRSALYTYLATFPGATLVGATADSVGRDGLAVDISSNSDGQDHEMTFRGKKYPIQNVVWRIVVDPETSTLLQIDRIRELATFRASVPDPALLPPSTNADGLSREVFIGPVVVGGENQRPDGVTFDSSGS